MRQACCPWGRRHGAGHAGALSGAAESIAGRRLWCSSTLPQTAGSCGQQGCRGRVWEPHRGSFGHVAARHGALLTRGQPACAGKEGGSFSRIRRARDGKRAASQDEEAGQQCGRTDGAAACPVQAPGVVLVGCWQAAEGSPCSGSPWRLRGGRARRQSSSEELGGGGRQLPVGPTWRHF